MTTTQQRRARRAFVFGGLTATAFAMSGCAGDAIVDNAPTGRPSPKAIAGRARITQISSDTVRIEVNEKFRRDVTAGLPDLGDYWGYVSSGLLLAAIAEAKKRGADSFALRADDGSVRGRGRGNGNWVRNVRISAAREAEVRYHPSEGFKSGAKGERFTLVKAEALAKELAAN